MDQTYVSYQPTRTSFCWILWGYSAKDWIDRNEKKTWRKREEIHSLESIIQCQLHVFHFDHFQHWISAAISRASNLAQDYYQMMWRNQTGRTSFVTTYTHIAAKLSTVSKLNLITQTLLKFAHRCPQPEHSNQQNSVRFLSKGKRHIALKTAI